MEAFRRRVNHRNAKSLPGQGSMPQHKNTKSLPDQESMPQHSGPNWESMSNHRGMSEK
jgi:hypothetical protein